MKSVNKFNFYLAIFIGMFDLTIFSTGNSLGQALTTVLLLFSILSDINKVFLKPFFFCYFIHSSCATGFFISWGDIVSLFIYYC